MGWVQLIMFILAYYLQKEKGRSDSTAALTGIAAAGASYYLMNADSTEPLFNSGQDSTQTGGTPDVVPDATGQTSGWSQLGSTLVSTTGGVLRSWGPTGTALVAGAVTGNTKWLWIAGLAAAALLLLK